MIESEMAAYPPSEVIANAMMVAVWKQISFELKHYKPKGEYSVWLDEITSRATSSACRLGSAYVIDYIQNNYREVIKNMLMVEGSNSGRWLWHDYFIVKGSDDCWYAGSPANFGKDPIERTTNLIKNKDLRVVMSEVQEIEGGAWPEAEEIEALLMENSDEVEIRWEGGRRVMNYLCILCDEGESVCQRFEIKL